MDRVTDPEPQLEHGPMGPARQSAPTGTRGVGRPSGSRYERLGVRSAARELGRRGAGGGGQEPSRRGTRCPGPASQRPEGSLSAPRNRSDSAEACSARPGLRAPDLGFCVSPRNGGDVFKEVAFPRQHFLPMEAASHAHAPKAGLVPAFRTPSGKPDPQPAACGPPRDAGQARRCCHARAPVLSPPGVRSPHGH